jgi:hypothetical protein
MIDYYVEDGAHVIDFLLVILVLRSACSTTTAKFLAKGILTGGIILAPHDNVIVLLNTTRKQ